MGLDMYLNRKSYKYVLRDGTLTTGSGMKFEDYSILDEFGCSNGITISENVAYWRKANQIHRWFVDNVQDGNDDCKEYYVGIEKLRELHGICKDIVAKIEGKKMYLDDETLKYVENWNSKKKQEECKKSGIPYKKDNRKKEIIFSLKGNLWKEIYSYNIELDDETKKMIEDNLPTQEGFFFGPTKIDGGYFYELIKTMKMLERLFKENKKARKNKDCYDYYYSASW